MRCSKKQEKRWVPTLRFADGVRWELVIGDRRIGRILREGERYEAMQFAHKVWGVRVFDTMREAACWLLTFV